MISHRRPVLTDMRNAVYLIIVLPLFMPIRASQKESKKPDYVDFESHKEAMIAGIKSGEKTPDGIISNLEKKFNVSNEIKAQIKVLGV